MSEDNTLAVLASKVRAKEKLDDVLEETIEKYQHDLEILRKITPRAAQINTLKGFMFIYNSATGEILSNDINDIYYSSQPGDFSILYTHADKDSIISKNNKVGFIKVDGLKLHDLIYDAYDEKSENFKEPYQNLFEFLFDKINEFREFGERYGDNIISETINKYNEEINITKKINCNKF